MPRNNEMTYPEDLIQLADMAKALARFSRMPYKYFLRGRFISLPPVG